MDLKNMLSEKSQTQKVTYYRILLICNIQKREIHRDRRQLVVTKGWREQGIGRACLMGRRFYFKGMNGLGMGKMSHNIMNVLNATG